MALWGGRFEEAADESLRQLNDSIGFDKRFYREDIAGSHAYAQALVKAGLLSVDEGQAIIRGLTQVQEEFDSGTFVFAEGDEDIHTAVERRLTELIGAVGGKLHTGRSRNDQVATDFRLWTMHAIDRLDVLLNDFQTLLIQQAETHADTVMPGYTHFQPAQPITTGHWLMSFFWMVARDRDRLNDARLRTSVMPLGSGALSGHPFDIDRQMLADALGFGQVSQNSLDAVSDRDFVAELLFVLALLGTHLSRLGEDVILYSNPALGFITLDDRYSTGSSLMPQKRNADPMELARGKSGRLIGHLSGLLTTLKGLPSGYNKDLQEDKEALFDAVDTLTTLLPVLSGVIATLQVNPDKMRSALAIEMLATDLADYLVEKGLPFREGHHVAGRLVRVAAEKKTTLDQLTLADYQAESTLFEDDVFAWLDFERSVARRRVTVGTAPDAVREQIQAAQAWLVAVAQT